MVVSRINKPKTKRGKRFLENRDPKVVENVKRAMFIKGGRTSEKITKTLKQFYILKTPFALMLSKKNILRPFDDSNPLEYLAQKNDHSLFMFGFDSKKRPDSLIIGRMFNNQVLDMFEFGIEKFISMEDFKNDKVTLGTKPMLVFNGEAFSVDPEYIRLKCLLTDYFRGEVVQNIRLQGLEHVINFTALDGKIYFRSFKTVFLKSGTKIPNVELTEIGPSFDFVVRRSKLASDDLYKKSKKQPKEIMPNKKKNVVRDGLGTTYGRIHMQKQDLDRLQLRKLKAFKRKFDKPDQNKSGNENNKKAKKDTVTE
ncbi:ribosome production factor 2 -like protein [Brachionus plicatilis]|uniref:Ribosome production factor 2 homolog n=1 Tax=Brachionus plicatilis TaxID=10195 RepID=A0A3M7T8U0_BRAPC|nr:ribosome production factor 2 -like protein [Brachionus plicatilis]